MIAVLMLVSSVAALAEGVNTGKTLDGSVQITGLDAGDVVNFYKVVGWDQSSGWVFDETFAGLATSGKDSSGNVLGWASPADPDTIKTDVLKYISGIPGDITTTYTNGTPTTTTTASVKGRINSTLAGKIASIVTGQPVDHSETVAETAKVNEGSVTWTNPDAGLYVALVTPKTTGTVYNPIFVAADYDSTNAPGYSNVQSAVLDPSLSYSDQAMAKKTVINVKKTINHDPDSGDIATAGTEEGGTATSVDGGELLQFKVETIIPEYSDLYNTAMFKITDTLTGLKLNISSTNKFEIKAKINDAWTVISADGNPIIIHEQAHLYNGKLAHACTVADKASYIEDNFWIWDNRVEYVWTPERIRYYRKLHAAIMRGFPKPHIK